MRKRKESGSDLELGGDSRRLTPIDVQQQQFRRSFRGYDEQEVDDFLDRVTEELSVLQEEKRTAAEQGQGQVLTTPLADVGQAAEATRAAEGIKRRAQEQAEAIVRDAQARAAAILRDADARAGTAASGGSASSDAPVPSAAGSAALSSFVSREREFLQRLAQLVQGHAEGVRDMVQSARRAQQAPAKADTGSPPAASPPAGIAPAVTPEAPYASEVPPAPPIPAAPEASPAFPAPPAPEAPSAPEAASAPEAPSAPMPP
ncbi:MAG: DivIVA domain-containing protein, partial [Actinomycetota bacterium]|nr:DivIVA domain-containing protein [Actinomycetota bacterium]